MEEKREKMLQIFYDSQDFFLVSVSTIQIHDCFVKFLWFQLCLFCEICFWISSLCDCVLVLAEGAREIGAEERCYISVCKGCDPESGG